VNSGVFVQGQRIASILRAENGVMRPICGPVPNNFYAINAIGGNAAAPIRFAAFRFNMILDFALTHFESRTVGDGVIVCDSADSISHGRITNCRAAFRDVRPVESQTTTA
jgi:hypothetical protein